jgi:Protein of unknown function (DUF2911)
MKKSILFLAGFLLINISIFAQSTSVSPIPTIDKSPMDMSTYPVDYQLLKIQGKVTETLAARVVYSRPQKNNRIIFGELLEYNTVWRFGANENTEIEFFRDVKINKSIVKKGKYSLFAIPSTTNWIIILNKDLNTWGSFKYDKAKDLLRVTVPLQKSTETSESFYIYFSKATNGFALNAGWDDVFVTLPISF